MNKNCMKHKTTFTIILLLSISTIFLLPIRAQPTFLRGDINGDGSIDTLDALLLLRDIEGIESLLNTEASRADVAPLPGTEGRSIGDGRLTREDAEKILRHSVGLIPKGELTGTFFNSPPQIQDFEPLSGAVGTQVTLYGENFVSALAAENLVMLGDLHVEILSLSGTKMEVKVPPGAQSGVWRVITPGGSDVSAARFQVTDTVTGRLDLGKVDPGNYVVVSSFDEADTKDDSGNFDIEVPPNDMSFLGAVPKDGGMNVYLAIRLPAPGQSASAKQVHPNQAEEDEVEVNALTTAKSLVFMHPFLMTGSLTAADALMDRMDGIPEVHDLAAVIDSRYPDGADGLEDAEVRSAWARATEAVIATLPDTLARPVETAAQAKRSHAFKSQPTLFAFPHALFDFKRSKPGYDEWTYSPRQGENSAVKVREADGDYLTASHNQKNGGIVAELGNEYSPLDWIVTLFRIDPEEMPLGMNTPFTEIRSKGFKHTGYQKSTLVAANQW
ncbi:hypothetical protein GF373_05400, partial [bacterium]|nr:hypothetical protein [bacterium]